MISKRTRSGSGLFSILLIAAAAAGSTNVGPRAVLDLRSAAASTNSLQKVTIDRSQFKVDPKPAVFESWADRLDYLHENVPRHLQQPITLTDAHFASLDEYSTTPQSRFRMGLYFEVKDREGIQWKVSPDFEADVSMPNIENRFKIFIESVRPGDLPGLLPTEKEQSSRIGVRKLLEGYNTKLDAGMEISFSPELFARVTWEDRWTAGLWRFGPQQRFFYETDDGFGELTSLRILRWFGSGECWAWESISALKVTVDNGSFWEQTMKVGCFGELIEEKWRGGDLSRQQIAKGSVLGYSVFGEGNVITKHRLEWCIRRPLRERWLFFEVRPGVEWENELDWDLVPKLTVGIDMLFWGKPEI